MNMTAAVTQAKLCEYKFLKSGRGCSKTSVTLRFLAFLQASRLKPFPDGKPTSKRDATKKKQGLASTAASSRRFIAHQANNCGCCCYEDECHCWSSGRLCCFLLFPPTDWPPTEFDISSSHFFFFLDMSIDHLAVNFDDFGCSHSQAINNFKKF